MVIWCWIPWWMKACNLGTKLLVRCRKEAEFRFQDKWSVKAVTEDCSFEMKMYFEMPLTLYCDKKSANNIAS